MFNDGTPIIIKVESQGPPKIQLGVKPCNQQSLRSACTYAQSNQSLCQSLEYSLSVKLMTEQHLEFLSLKGGCSGSSESTLVKMHHCWKSHAATRMCWIYTATEIYLFKATTKINGLPQISFLNDKNRCFSKVRVCELCSVYLMPHHGEPPNYLSILLHGVISLRGVPSFDNMLCPSILDDVKVSSRH